MIVMVGIIACLGLFIGVFLVYCFKKVPSNMAGIRTGFGGIKVTKSYFLCLPFMHRFDLMDMSIQEIKIKLKGVNGVRCKDNIRADIEASFYVRVDHDEESICEVATSVGCEHASDVGTLKGLFEAKFSDSLQSVASQYDNEELRKIREEFRHSIRTYIGSDLNGFLLEDVAIDYLEQTPKEEHDPSDILDAKAIEKIARLTAQSQEAANKTIYEMEVKQNEQAVAAELKKRELALQNTLTLVEKQRELEAALKETFPDKNKIEELRSQIAQLEEQDSSES
ncbi:MAG: SPFH domain-containing protein [Verrucomicrobiota bacterium]|jgi:uncharacterized membrane protein YqiK|nr:SPFH domain-containing protein [Verrucomicrobiota bacterium]